jgi:lysyl-tRNA synthetase class 2
LPATGLTFVYDFPADQAALANIRAGSPPVAERFELYLGQTELANGYQELTDAGELHDRFKVENTQRAEKGLETVQIDQNLLAALEHGLPGCSGVALGVDRLLMNLCGTQMIDEVTAFPWSRA